MIGLGEVESCKIMLRSGQWVPDTIRLLARPVGHARSMMPVLKAGHAIEMNVKLEGITVSYRYVDVMKMITKHWPHSVLNSEAGRNPVESALPAMEGDDV
jgi:hypothetical protein